MMSSIVVPSPATGNNRRIELAGLDLLIYPRIDNVFVYPTELEIDRFKDALSHTLSLWPLVAGRFLMNEGGHYYIQMSDNGIPVTYTENSELEYWPLNNNVVIEIVQNSLVHFIDGVETTKLLTTPNEVPLVRLKLTHIVKSGEWVLGSSWAHILGDAASNMNFLHTVSCVYQQMEPIKSLPIFERRLWKENEADQALLPLLKELYNAKPPQEMFARFFSHDDTTEHVNLHFSGEQLSRLRHLANANDTVTIQDALTSYIIVLLNIHCYKDDLERLIRSANIAINFRGVSDSIAPNELVSNAILILSTEAFDNPYSLSTIAKTIRRSIVRTRDPKFLETCAATADTTLRKMLIENRMINLGPFQNDITVNSNFRYDWASLVDFGFTDKCRFYTLWTGKLYFRVFRLNPIKTGNDWLPRDHHGAEIAFRIPKDIKDKFISAWQNDVKDNFSNVQL